MPNLTKEQWQAWNDERQRFAHRDTGGLDADLKALKAHILKLQEVCPKDVAGWPVGIALNRLDKLRHDYDRFIHYLEQLR